MLPKKENVGAEPIALVGVESPILPLLPRIARAPFKIAPERTRDLSGVWKKHVQEIRGFLKQNPYGSGFQSTVLGQRIFFDLPCLENIWVHAYGFQILLRVFQKAHANPKGYVFAKDIEFVEAMPFLAQGWLHDIGESEAIIWPPINARPDQSSANPNVRAANNLFIRMVGFAFLHETAHIILTHTGDQSERKQEKLKKEFEADTWACHWIFDKWREHNNDPGEFVRRAISVAFALSLQSAVDIHVNKEKDHPNTVDRLTSFLERFVWSNKSLAEDHIAVELAVRVVIDVHLALAGQDLQRGLQLKDHLVAVRPYFLESPVATTPRTEA